MLQLLKKNGLAKTWRSLKQLQPSLPQNSQSGFTILESLMAVVVTAVLMTALSPVIVLAVANRVQARRVELAAQAARTYIDGVRNGTIATPAQISSTSLSNFAAPTAPLPSCSSNSYCVGSQSLYCIDGDGSGSCTSNISQDLIIQVFRDSPNPDNGYHLGLRVYRADAFNDNSPLLTNTTQATNATQATFTGGLGNRKAPLVEMTTEVVTSATNYGNLCSRIGGCQ